MGLDMLKQLRVSIGKLGSDRILPQFLLPREKRTGWGSKEPKASKAVSIMTTCIENTRLNALDRAPIRKSLQRVIQYTTFYPRISQIL